METRGGRWKVVKSEVVSGVLIYSESKVASRIGLKERRIKCDTPLGYQHTTASHIPCRIL